ncbi:helix-turn-helix domain-containing protein [Salinarimonas rosea]|uniref:helix-turn-helix domain-containing protein n=1 Tax=Salinarimonas rosea TaxID=552063 RepID=UPI000420F99A
MARRTRDPQAEARALTPFGRHVRRLRAARGLQLKHMAAHLGVSSAYLSALERGERGRPTFTLVQGTIHYFGVIWDEADELQRLAELSDPAPRIPAAAAGPDAVLLANRLAREIGGLDAGRVEAMLAILDGIPATPDAAAELDGPGTSGSNPSRSGAPAPSRDPSPDQDSN